MWIQMELHKIIISENRDEQRISLKEVSGERKLTMVIASPEAMAIDRRLKGLRTPRPMTHDLLASVIEAMGGEFKRIEIHDLNNGTFFAHVIIQQNGKPISIDARPSDSIALGIATNVPIFVADHVLADAAD